MTIIADSQTRENLSQRRLSPKKTRSRNQCFLRARGGAEASVVRRKLDRGLASCLTCSQQHEADPMK